MILTILEAVAILLLFCIAVYVLYYHVFILKQKELDRQQEHLEYMIMLAKAQDETAKLVEELLNKRIHKLEEAVQETADLSEKRRLTLKSIQEEHECALQVFTRRWKERMEEATRFKVFKITAVDEVPADAPTALVLIAKDYEDTQRMLTVLELNCSAYKVEEIKRSFCQLVLANYDIL